MNFLLNKYPNSINIDNKDYEINSDFRTCLKIIICFEDKELTNYEKFIISLKLFYKEIPENTEEAYKEMIKFLDVNEEEEKQDSKRVYSFTKDSLYIANAIRKTHNIDIETSEMHWWKFISLFMELDKDCFFNHLIYLRKQKQKGKLTEAEKEMYYSLGDVVKIEQDLNLDLEEQRELDNFFELLKGGEDESI